MFQPLSVPLQNGIRFLRIPLPALHSASLTVCLPAVNRRSTGLPCFLYMTNEWVRIRLSAGSRYVRVTLAWRRLSDCVPFGLEPSIITAHSKLRRLSTVHITLFIPFSLAPLSFDTNGSCHPLTVQTSPFGRASLLVLLPHGFIA